MARHRRDEVTPRLSVVFGLMDFEAAAAIGIGLTKFRELVEDKRMPPPRQIDGRLVWDVDELKLAFRAFPHVGCDQPDPVEDDGSWDDLRRR